ncbi:MAG: glycosyltransferase family 2 protein [Nitrososphaerota archaeon]|nr:glycosyltransferase family 2 protein [Nitrososphaerota archaeon]
MEAELNYLSETTPNYASPAASGGYQSEGPSAKPPSIGKVDVCVPSLEALPEKLVRNIEETIPVNRLLTVIGLPRGPARQNLIDRVETEFFVFVDSDVVIYPWWFEDASSLVGPKVGAVEGRPVGYGDPRINELNAAMDGIGVRLGRGHFLDRVERAFTGATLIRTDAVKGIRIPNTIWYEDEYIRRHIESRGYSWLRSRRPDYWHWGRKGARLQEMYESAVCAYNLGFMKPGTEIRRLLYKTPIKALYVLRSTGDPSVASILVRRQIARTRGLLHAKVQADEAPGDRRGVLSRSRPKGM